MVISLIIEYIMYKMQWCDIWYAQPCKLGIKNLFKKHFFVGVWTGEQGD